VDRRSVFLVLFVGSCGLDDDLTRCQVAATSRAVCAHIAYPDDTGIFEVEYELWDCSAYERRRGKDKEAIERFICQSAAYDEADCSTPDGLDQATLAAAECDDLESAPTWWWWD
jgi:hypothetical protein